MTIKAAYNMLGVMAADRTQHQQEFVKKRIEISMIK
jgi:hypothetical protein